MRGLLLSSSIQNYVGFHYNRQTLQYRHRILTLIIYIVFAAAAIIIVIIIMMVIIPSSEMTVYILLITLSQGLIDALLVSLEA